MIFIKSKINWIGSILAVLVVSIFCFRVWSLEGYTDFDVYYSASKKILSSDWLKIYDLTDGRTPFRYPPVFLPLFQFFGMFDYKVARQLWFFVQVAAFFGVFYTFYLAFKELLCDHKEALLVSIVGFILSIRFIIDSFLIGQVASLMLLGYSLSFLFWIREKSLKALFFQLIPTAFKIGPGVSILVFILYLRSKFYKTIISISGMIVALLALTWIWLGDWTLLWQLLMGWIDIVRNDGNYIDSSHYGSQSVLSFLLRTFPKDMAFLMSNIFRLIVISGFIYILINKNPKTKQDRANLFSLSVFPYIWLMPQTFKYSMHPVVIPLMLAFVSDDKKLSKKALIIFIVFVAFAGKDIVGDGVFFWIQKMSLPLFATFPLAFWNFKEVLKIDIKTKVL